MKFGDGSETYPLFVSVQVVEFASARVAIADGGLEGSNTAARG